MQFARVVATDSAQGRNAVVVVQGVEFLDVTAFGFGGCELVGFDDLAGFEGIVIPGPAKLVALEQEPGLASDLRIVVAGGLADLCQGEGSESFESALRFDPLGIGLRAELNDPALDFLLVDRRGSWGRLGVGLRGECPGANREEKKKESETGSCDFSLEGCLDLGHGVAQPLLRVG